MKLSPVKNAEIYRIIQTRLQDIRRFLREMGSYLGIWRRSLEVKKGLPANI
jgi:hypothetical protein